MDGAEASGGEDEGFFPAQFLFTEHVAGDVVKGGGLAGAFDVGLPPEPCVRFFAYPCLVLFAVGGDVLAEAFSVGFDVGDFFGGVAGVVHAVVVGAAGVFRVGGCLLQGFFHEADLFGMDACFAAGAVEAAGQGGDEFGFRALFEVEGTFAGGEVADGAEEGSVAEELPSGPGGAQGARAVALLRREDGVGEHVALKGGGEGGFAAALHVFVEAVDFGAVGVVFCGEGCCRLHEGGALFFSGEAVFDFREGAAPHVAVIDGGSALRVDHVRGADEVDVAVAAVGVGFVQPGDGDAGKGHSSQGVCGGEFVCREAVDGR